MFTVTGASSRFPAASGWASCTVTATVGSGDRGELPLSLGVVATRDTEAIVPGVLLPSGRVTATASPAATRCWSLTGTAASTTAVVEVAVSTGLPGCTGAPSLAATEATRSASGP